MPVALTVLHAIVWANCCAFGSSARVFGALVRPLIWLIVCLGLSRRAGLSIIRPTKTISPTTYITPGLVGMIQLFNGMQHSLSLVYDREMGSMRAA